jgi:hypothetical protein
MPAVEAWAAKGLTTWRVGGSELSRGKSSLTGGALPGAHHASPGTFRNDCHAEAIMSRPAAFPAHRSAPSLPLHLSKSATPVQDRAPRGC